MRRPTWIQLGRGAARLRGDAGVTLPELLVATTVLGVVMTAVTAGLVGATRGQADLNRRFQAQESARLALATLTRELHCASAVSPASGSTSAIVITLPAGCTTGTGSVTWCTVANGTTYDLWRVPAGSCATATAGSRRVATGLTGANAFSPDATVHGASPVLASVGLTLSVATGKTPYLLTNTIYLRNAVRQ